ncbi:DoxX family protein [Niabella sp. CC-SYL272]|uniref:DoxX family protein n=1 Tax=Niabella agricola TaxID=2891571 RepID=UPI001F176125|nr:DoxX family protein [Niabella agricola]MCF3110284.1 DoxX family protein [Niabella agricola]
MKKYQEIAAILLRLCLAAGFLSAVASRLGYWGHHSSGWSNFIIYTEQVNSFVPKRAAGLIAVVSTITETTLGLLLIFGYKTRYAAIATALLTLAFAIAMSWSFGIKEALDYSVFAFSMGAFLLATLPHHKWSIDQLLK